MGIWFREPGLILIRDPKAVFFKFKPKFCIAFVEHSLGFQKLFIYSLRAAKLGLSFVLNRHTPSPLPPPFSPLLLQFNLCIWLHNFEKFEVLKIKFIICFKRETFQRRWKFENSKVIEIFYRNLLKFRKLFV